MKTLIPYVVADENGYVDRDGRIWFVGEQEYVEAIGVTKDEDAIVFDAKEYHREKQ